MYSQKRKNNPKGFRVFTESGVFLGRVFSFSLDIKTGEITSISVRKSFLTFYYGHEILIDRSQILKIERERIIVADAYLSVAMGEAL